MSFQEEKKIVVFFSSRSRICKNPRYVKLSHFLKLKDSIRAKLVADCRVFMNRMFNVEKKSILEAKYLNVGERI